MTKDLKTIEYDKILALAAEFSVNTHTKPSILELRPSSDTGEVRRLLAETDEAVKLLYFFNAQPLGSFDSVGEILTKCGVASVLSMAELLKVMRFLRCARVARTVIGSYPDTELPLLSELASGLYYDKRLEDDISVSILSDSEVSDRASEKLASIRKKIRACNERIRERLQHFMRSESKYLQDSLITIREGRFVLPVKSECRGSVPGLLHDQSASGATVFIEPMAVVEANNELKSLYIDEQFEIEEILKAFSLRVLEALEPLKLTETLCTMLDIILSRAKFSVNIGGTMPEINKAAEIYILSGRHPLIDKGKVVPVNIEISKSKRILLISGPNTGGKTVALKTVALFSAMAASGFFVPAKVGTRIAVFDNIFCDIGDEQSIESSLSTFSSHIVNISRIAEAVTVSDLVLIDEAGAGTDPREGAALARGILKYFASTGCIALVTTHYSELKQYALTAKEIINASMEFDEETLRPTYRLLMGVPGMSNALAMAGQIGLKKEIIEDAERCMTGDSGELETALREAYKAKAAAGQDLETAQRKLAEAESYLLGLKKKEEALERERQKITENARIEIKRIVQNSVSRAHELIEEIKDKIDRADEKALLEAKRARNEIEELMYGLERSEIILDEHVDILSPLEVGEDVLIKSLNTKGKVLSPPDKRGDTEVLAGSIRTKVNVSDLARLIKRLQETKKQKRIPQPQAATKNIVAVGTAEIKLLGLTVSEAEEKLDVFLADCIVRGVKEVKIIHGLGTGALRKGVAEYLRRNPRIESYRAGKYGEGDRGVTFALLH